MSATPQALAVATAQVDLAQVNAFTERGVNEALAVALAQAVVIIDNGIDALPLNSYAKPLVAHELEWLAKQTSPSLPRKGAQAAGGWAQTKGLALQALGILRAFNLDARVQVSTRDVTRYRLAQILLSYPLYGPKKKIRQPSARFKPSRRKPTEREREGLRKGNEQRALAAKKSREAKQAARA